MVRLGVDDMRECSWPRRCFSGDGGWFGRHRTTKVLGESCASAAGNILIDARGAVKLADFGVAASMFDTGDRLRARNTFVGTPCWMAPEVMQQLHGYDFKADIWSFGITALELAHGHAPFSKYPPMKVLLMTLQNAAPALDYERDEKFSKSFKKMVASCLVKDPKKRPSSEKLLKHPFFKHAHSNDYLARAILDGLPPLADRFKTLKGREEEILLQSRTEEDKEQLSQRLTGHLSAVMVTTSRITYFSDKTCMQIRS
ncbi:Mitogen-activated protein kinase kinase kinase 1 [Platanthera guangdongensis]|uniref:Mitogen-activated protein kinase kinase kinase 1 n=1 Tax=Platanthera guangdongensis TaxID=2320717 RepID=A0ABR2LKS8_9ASPA